jgi:Skp family chaperone for outer membrane proteins
MGIQSKRHYNNQRRQNEEDINQINKDLLSIQNTTIKIASALLERDELLGNVEHKSEALLHAASSYKEEVQQTTNSGLCITALSSLYSAIQSAVQCIGAAVKEISEIILGSDDPLYGDIVVQH